MARQRGDEPRTRRAARPRTSRGRPALRSLRPGVRGGRAARVARRCSAASIRITSSGSPSLSVMPWALATPSARLCLVGLFARRRSGCLPRRGQPMRGRGSRRRAARWAAHDAASVATHDSPADCRVVRHGAIADSAGHGGVARYLAAVLADGPPGDGPLLDADGSPHPARCVGGRCARRRAGR